MPVTAFFQSAATFFYALSSLMGGAHQYAGNNMNHNHVGFQIPAARQGFLQNIPELPQHFTPPPLEAISNPMHSSAAYNNFALPRNTQPGNPTTVPAPIHPTTTFQQDPVVSESVQNLKQRARGLVSLLTYRPPKPQQVSGTDHERNTAITNNASEHQKKDEEIQAVKTLRKIVDDSLTKENRSGLPPLEEITYYEAETIATLFLEPDGAIARCRLIEVIEPEDARRVLRMIAERQKRIENTNFGTMLTIITACQSLDPQAPPQSPTIMQADDMLNNHRVALSGYSPLAAHNSNFNLTSANNPNLNMWSLVSGIVPGTKWCGLGDISASYDDLGPERHLDKCCRAHDHCPIKIKAFRSRYGLVNWSIYTKSHCECDSLFYECLKKAAIPQAELLGNFYFNVLRVQCVDDADQTKCAARDPSSGACKLWQPDDNQPTRMLFRTLRRNF